MPQMMVCRLYGTKPLFEPVLDYCWLDHWKKIKLYFKRDPSICTDDNKIEFVFKILSRPQCVNLTSPEYVLATRSVQGQFKFHQIFCQLWTLKVCIISCIPNSYSFMMKKNTANFLINNWVKQILNKKWKINRTIFIDIIQGHLENRETTWLALVSLTYPSMTCKISFW